ncbi:tRNA (guanosine(46)-N7)-methyltransferase TrmB [Saccharicrinis sp. FJH2]|uniref:tRNA (guanosine(46)-N7)-methyltransferase TrmB n=1 Tax=Saccharicrinis sp. FJH65 TaxID=3344659 RepID=UPI0035F35BB2
MGKGKLQKFADMETFPHVFQYPFGVLKEKGFSLKGKWNKGFFKNTNPVVLELGCGKGEYTVGLGRLFPEKNFIGIDIKGARMWSGARQSFQEGMSNVAFIRTSIELLDHFFEPGEVSEIWLTFPDPQMKKVRKRLTATNFMELYRKVMKPDGLIHLKTDSNFQYRYTCEMVKENGFEVLESTDDLYHEDYTGEVLSIRTHYEQQWLERGLTIKYIRFRMHDKSLREPEVEIEHDAYRSYNRSKRGMKEAGA